MQEISAPYDFLFKFCGEVLLESFTPATFERYSSPTELKFLEQCQCRISCNVLFFNRGGAYFRHGGAGALSRRGVTLRDNYSGVSYVLSPAVSQRCIHARTVTEE